MEPRIQYATTSDGVSIAYWAMGEGLPFVHMPWFRVSHVQLEWEVPEVRRWYEALAEKTRLVRYDWRGIGLSQREAPDYSPCALVLDLEAGVGPPGVGGVVVFGVRGTGAGAVAVAGRPPPR